ncbi:enamine deaminase RidA (YjgF/YER057c/UK114 family) [Devosia subaequoris]|uniref:Enamine deaminase RidA (YjgF/YER057c/UK114 family) n=1 Tax=Devosia subaequoris TaxID=395930 RepID=A0A7W6NDE6_9HYPH|nr:RidA family protein [Devosia subaequoris]MBB4053953.1 enamine deaminase RidA (YjgF/YER057c/UK114 family) [Devosia subaequoris]MCP1211457.1 RidA family protein [Devosia subaequoris]
MSIDARLKELGIELPNAASPSFNYMPVILHRGIAYVSGQMPKVDGEVRVFGKVGAEVDLQTAQGEARICILQGLACLRQALGSLDRIEQIIKVNGFVASAPGFNAQPKVLDAASDLLAEIFGEAGRHARAAIGAAELPRNAAVEIEMTVAYRD